MSRYWNLEQQAPLYGIKFFERHKSCDDDNIGGSGCRLQAAWAGAGADWSPVETRCRLPVFRQDRVSDEAGCRADRSSGAGLRPDNQQKIHQFTKHRRRYPRLRCVLLAQYEPCVAASVGLFFLPSLLLWAKIFSIFCSVLKTRTAKGPAFYV